LDNGSEFAEHRQLLRPSQPRSVFVTRTTHASVAPMKIRMAWFANISWKGLTFEPCLTQS